MFNKILIAVDGSEHAARAIEAGCEIATRFNASILVLHVMEEIGSSRVPEELEEVEHLEHIRITDSDILMGVARNIVQNATSACVAHGCKAPASEIQVGSPPKAIVETAKRDGSDLIILGRRGLGRLSDLMLGSVSHRVTQLADCACLTVR